MQSAIRGTRTTFGQPVDPDNFGVKSIYDEPVSYPLRGLWPTAVSGLVATLTEGSNVVELTTGNTSQVDVSQVISDAAHALPTNTAVISVIDSTHFVVSANATADETGDALTLLAPVALTGDWQQGILGVRADLTYDILTEATLYDDLTGQPTIALAQSQAVGLMVVARFGFTVANWATYQAPNEATRYPFAALLA